MGTFTQVKEVTETALHEMLADLNDPDGQWLCEAVQHHDVDEIVGGYIPQDNETERVIGRGDPVDIRLVQYIGGRLFVETVPALVDGNGDIWVSDVHLG